MAREIHIEERRELAEAKVTLNGNRARIGGVKNQFAIVTDLETGLSAEWAWPTVARIVETRNGAFKS